MSQRLRSVGIATDYGLDDQGIEVRFLAEARDLSLLHSGHTDTGAHTTPYPMGNRGCFYGVI
jgi:hypothetical protein